MRFLWCYPLFHLFILYWDSRFFYPLCFIILGFSFFIFVCLFGDSYKKGLR
nr:MAG TPA: hypothetical protein [Caudoviricetes sp.]